MNENKPFCTYNNPDTRTKIFLRWVPEKGMYIDFTNNFFLRKESIEHLDNYLKFFETREEMI